MNIQITAKILLGLKRGSEVRIRSGNETKVVKVLNSDLAAIGKPGMHRVRLRVLDLGRLGKVSDEQNTMMLAYDKNAVREVGGDKVVEVLHAI